MKARQPARVLLVEDNEADVRLMEEALHECYPRPVDLIAIEDGDEALALLDKGAQFDLIVLDLNLPGLDGYGFLQQRPAGDVPIVVFSSSWNEDESRMAVSLGAREFISKPSSYAEYVKAVCGFVDRWSKAGTQQAGQS
jgi:CheY-like chemotaxis protein